MKLPKAPKIVLTENNVTTIPESGFLRVRRGDTTFNYPNGEKSKPFPADRIVRRCEDAVIIVAWYHGEDGPYVYLRSSIRPALALRDYSASEMLEGPDVGNLWELPAGLIEANEPGILGVLNAASREAKEEIGFSVATENINLLGQRSFPAVGMSGERLFFVSMEVNPSERGSPSEDGGPFEAYGEVIAVHIIDILKAIDDGQIVAAPTEIGVRRLYDSLNW